MSYCCKLCNNKFTTKHSLWVHRNCKGPCIVMKLCTVCHEPFWKRNGHTCYPLVAKLKDAKYKCGFTFSYGIDILDDCCRKSYKTEEGLKLHTMKSHIIRDHRWLYNSCKVCGFRRDNQKCRNDIVSWKKSRCFYCYGKMREVIVTLYLCLNRCNIQLNKDIRNLLRDYLMKIEK